MSVAIELGKEGNKFCEKMKGQIRPVLGRIVVGFGKKIDFFSALYQAGL